MGAFIFLFNLFHPQTTKMDAVKGIKSAVMPKQHRYKSNIAPFLGKKRHRKIEQLEWVPLARKPAKAYLCCRWKRQAKKERAKKERGVRSTGLAPLRLVACKKKALRCGCAVVGKKGAAKSLQSRTWNGWKQMAAMWCSSLPWCSRLVHHRGMVLVRFKVLSCSFQVFIVLYFFAFYFWDQVCVYFSFHVLVLCFSTGANVVARFRLV